MEVEKEAARARTATGEDLNALIYHPVPAVLTALLDNPAFDEPKLTLLLSRKDLPTEILEEIGRRKAFLKSYAVKKGLVLHPRTPRLVGLRLLKDLYLMDLVQFTLLRRYLKSSSATHRNRLSRVCRKCRSAKKSRWPGVGQVASLVHWSPTATRK